MLKTIQNPLLKQFEGIGHAFFTRQGGVSTGIYQGLNCNLASGDDPKHVIENQKRALAHLGLQHSTLASYDAQHANLAVIIEKPGQAMPQADAIITNHPQVVLGADSADCPTILLADPNARVIGLAHAGWRSALGGIVEATLQQMLSLGARAAHMTAVIGPGIAQASYEVSEPFIQQFLESDPNNQIFFLPTLKPQHWLFDLPGYIQMRLKRLALGQIACITLDTYTHDDLFYSCRRSFHQGLGDFGGHLACIYLDSCR
ncbi:peptidoglycan editing factor PgeF [Candidatus Berkiella aquae]|uniref:Purine nucleoside phosphorylase n=1 Tax=Candidatus Berkiella aquae TaxID=295108 RepID=A0A0Q9YMN6_9GAMM|nr:peptidoglycan editing factor PgeF [Candidatus Berkiella aquae]MCS5709802.1 peptidoglycan editing factor PgeF [Candidatus Berkiella aquae]